MRKSERAPLQALASFSPLALLLPPRLLTSCPRVGRRAAAPRHLTPRVMWMTE